jgi:septal ring factor EnvC (AmiA/AmiB activator)
MTNQSEFDVTIPRVPAPRRGAFVAALLLGLILGGGLTALWAVYGSASLKEPPADVAASSSNETAQAIKDLQATQQKIAGQLQSSQQTLESEQAEIKQALASEQADTKRLSDQVTGLSGKLDALQQSFARAQQQQSSPASSEPPTAAAKRRR